VFPQTFVALPASHFADAIRAEVLRSSPVLATRLRPAKDDMATLRAAAPVSQGSVTRRISAIAAKVRRAPERLAGTITAVDTTRARKTIHVRPDAEKNSLNNAKGYPDVALSRAAGSAAIQCGGGARSVFLCG